MKPAEIEVDGWLLCPDCASNNMHSTDTIVRGRPKEDQPGHQANINGEASVALVSTTSSFHGRRQDIEIGFFCEQCDGDGYNSAKRLLIVQHKGSTSIYWTGEG